MIAILCVRIVQNNIHYCSEQFETTIQPTIEDLTIVNAIKVAGIHKNVGKQVYGIGRYDNHNWESFCCL